MRSQEGWTLSSAILQADVPTLPPHLHCPHVPSPVLKENLGGDTTLKLPRWTLSLSLDTDTP